MESGSQYTLNILQCVARVESPSVHLLLALQHHRRRRQHCHVHCQRCGYVVVRVTGDSVQQFVARSAMQVTQLLGTDLPGTKAHHFRAHVAVLAWANRS